MSLSRVLVFGLTAVACLSLGGLVADTQAATVTYSATTSLSPYLNAPYTFPSAPLPKFDVPGGCLSSVCLRLEGQAFGFISIENFEAFPKLVTVTWGGQFNLLRPSLTSLLSTTATLTKPYSLTSFDGGVDYAGTSGVTESGLAAAGADSVCTSSAADLALFSGPGTISLPCVATNISTHNGANSWSFGVLALAKVDVTYTYSICSTPVKPTTWGRVKNMYR